MSAEELRALARRVCEEPPSRELEHTVAQALGWRCRDWGSGDEWKPPQGSWHHTEEEPPTYLHSLDAARTISTWVLIHASDIGADGLPLVVLGNPATTPAGEVRAIAYCGGEHALVAAFAAAALLARAAEMEDQDEAR